MKTISVVLVSILTVAFALAALNVPPTVATADIAELTPEVEVIVVVMLPTMTPSPMPTPRPTPTPTPRPDLPYYPYPDEEERIGARAIRCITPLNPSWETRLAIVEVGQNRVDDESGDYADTLRAVYLQPGEFLDYDPDAYISDINREAADYAARSWQHAKRTGDRSYRLTPPDGLLIGRFYRIDGVDYVQILNRDREVVYDSGAGIVQEGA